MNYLGYDTQSVQTREYEAWALRVFVFMIQDCEQNKFLRNVVWHFVLMEEQDGGM